MATRARKVRERIPGRFADELSRTARLLGEQAAELAHYRKMYDRSSALAKIGVWQCDLATETLTWTDGVYDLFELPRGSPVTREQILALYDEESRTEIERRRAEAIATGGSFSLDVRICTARGNPRWLRLTIDVEQDELGRPVSIFGTKQDITEARLAEEKVKALQAELLDVSRRGAMGAMAATVAHELNQPLAAIGNYAAGTRRALERPEPSPAAVAAGLEAIEFSALRAGRILRSLRQVVQGGEMKPEPVNPDSLIREAAVLAVAGALEGVALQFRFAEGLVVTVDPIQLQQVIINLVRNAVEAMHVAPQREIVISTFAVEGGVEIHVDDSGPGIAPDLLPSIFDAFVSSKRNGMGVGLAISRTIVEAHGGRITAVNRHGGGASLRIRLPGGKGEKARD